MDCEKLRVAIAKKSNFATNINYCYIIHFSERRSQFDFLEGRKCEIAKNCDIDEKTIFVARIQPILKNF